MDKISHEWLREQLRKKRGLHFRLADHLDTSSKKVSKTISAISEPTALGPLKLATFDYPNFEGSVSQQAERVN